MRAPRWWDEQVLPRMVDRACSGREADRRRDAVCRGAGVRGTVLEFGFASGANLPFYGDDVEQVLAVEPADLAWERSAQRRAAFGRSVTRVSLDAAALDLPDHCVDAVVSTWTLCTIPDLPAALSQARRVLRPGAGLHFVEHTMSSRPLVASTQRMLQPAWGLWAGGCHLDRDIPGELGSAAYTIDHLQSAGWFVAGIARPRRT